MPRLTITLSDARHRALKEAAARRRKSIASIIEESLEASGIKDIESAAALVARARQAAGMTPDEAMEFAIQETRAVRST
jgi:predicted transcriptional regulator